MLTLIPLAAFAVIAVALLICLLWPAPTPRRYTGTLKRLG